jgi:cation-transporting ATPase 13A1
VEPIEAFDPDAEKAAEFKVTLVNTAVFLISVSMQASTIFTNYLGKPFMKGLSSNKWLTRTLAMLWGTVILATSEVWPEFNAFLELQAMGPAFRTELAMLMLADFTGAWVVQYMCSLIFPLGPPTRVAALTK